MSLGQGALMLRGQVLNCYIRWPLSLKNASCLLCRLPPCWKTALLCGAPGRSRCVGFSGPTMESAGPAAAATALLRLPSSRRCDIEPSGSCAGSEDENCRSDFYGSSDISRRWRDPLSHRSLLTRTQLRIKCTCWRAPVLSQRSKGGLRGISNASEEPTSPVSAR